MDLAAGPSEGGAVGQRSPPLADEETGGRTRLRASDARAAREGAGAPGSAGPTRAARADFTGSAVSRALDPGGAARRAALVSGFGRKEGYDMGELPRPARRRAAGAGPTERVQLPCRMDLIPHEGMMPCRMDLMPHEGTMPGGGLADRNSGTAGSGTLQRLQLHFNFTSTSSSLLFVTIYKFSSNCSSNW